MKTLVSKLLLGLLIITCLAMTACNRSGRIEIKDGKPLSVQSKQERRALDSLINHS